MCVYESTCMCMSTRQQNTAGFVHKCLMLAINIATITDDDEGLVWQAVVGSLGLNHSPNFS